MKQTLWMMILCLAFFSACHKADDTGVVDLGIDYSINEDPLVFDTLRYQTIPCFILITQCVKHQLVFVDYLSRLFQCLSQSR